MKTEERHEYVDFMSQGDGSSGNALRSLQFKAYSGTGTAMAGRHMLAPRCTNC